VRHQQSARVRQGTGAPPQPLAYLWSIVLDGDLHIPVCVLLRLQALEGRLDLDEEAARVREGGFIWRDDRLAHRTGWQGELADEWAYRDCLCDTAP
jgi:hypothetical protein